MFRQQFVLQWLLWIGLFCIIFVERTDPILSTSICIKTVQSLVRKIFCGLLCASGFICKQYAAGAPFQLIEICCQRIRP